MFQGASPGRRMPSDVVVHEFRSLHCQTRMHARGSRYAATASHLGKDSQVHPRGSDVGLYEYGKAVAMKRV